MSRLLEKYRPLIVDDIIGQEGAKQVAKSVIRRIKNGERGTIRLLFSGPPGVGKTTMAHAIARELYGANFGSMFVEFNASDDRGVDFVRNQLKSIMTMKADRVIFLDEADNLTADAQQAMRRVIETPGNEGSLKLVIFSVNDPTKLINPILSRFVMVSFHPLSSRDIVKLVISVMKGEGWKFQPGASDEDKKSFLRWISAVSGGDARKCLTELDKSVNDDGFVMTDHVGEFFSTTDRLLEALMKRDVEEAISIALNLPNDPYVISHVSRSLRDSIILDGDGNVKSLSSFDQLLLLNLGKMDVNIKRGGDPSTQLVAFIVASSLAGMSDDLISRR